MNTRFLKAARRLFNSPFVSKEINRANQLKWVRAIRALGPRWPYWETKNISCYRKPKT